jgi:hypothetical protein
VYLLPLTYFNRKLRDIIKVGMMEHEMVCFNSWRHGLDLDQQVDREILLVRVIRVFVETADHLLKSVKLIDEDCRTTKDILDRYHAPYDLHRKRLNEETTIARTELNVQPVFRLALPTGIPGWYKHSKVKTINDFDVKNLLVSILDTARLVDYPIKKTLTNVVDEEAQSPFVISMIERLAKDLTWYRDTLKIAYRRNGTHLTKFIWKIEGTLDHLNEKAEKAKAKAELKMVQENRSI